LPTWPSCERTPAFARPTARNERRRVPGETQTTILDDHTPFLRAGIPAVDLIDWSYDGHSNADALDKLSQRSVAAVGETLVEFARTYRAPAR
jgi:hypothetical protein